MFLTNESLKLINKHKKSKETINISDKSFYKIYKNLNLLNYEIRDFKIFPIKRKKSPIFGFMNKTLEKKIENYNSCKKYEWTVNNRCCEISIIFNIYQIPNNKVNLNIDYLKDIISFGVSGAKDNLSITIHFIPLKEKKFLRKNQKYITVDNINSAACYFRYPVSEICIFRIEEFSKVILHELQHASNQYVILNNNMINSVINQKYNINTDKILLNESYTEIQGRLLNAFYVSKQMPTNNYEYFKYLLNLEYKFSIYQMNKILKYNQSKKLQKIDNDTNVVAYYIITTEIFSDLENFLNVDLQYFQEYIMNIPKLKAKKNVNDNHMRMSLLEVNILI